LPMNMDDVTSCALVLDLTMQMSRRLS
jgi:hypothetical protein